MKKSRVNISLDLETNGAKKSVELPFKVLAVGNYFQKKSSSDIKARKPKKISKYNIDQVLNNFGSLKLRVANKISRDEYLSTELKIRKYSDFSPEAIVQQVPALQKLQAIRNLLTDFKANLMDDADLAKAMKELTQDQQKMLELKQALIAK